MVTIADLRDVAATIDSPESAPDALITRAARALGRHDPTTPLDGALRALRWPDVAVRECVAAVAQARRALDAAE